MFVKCCAVLWRTSQKAHFSSLKSFSPLNDFNRRHIWQHLTMQNKLVFTSLLLLLLLLPYYISSLVSYTLFNGTRVDLPSTSFFRFQEPFYNLTGQLQELVLVKGIKPGACILDSLKMSLFPPGINQETVIFFDYSYSACQLDCISEVCSHLFRLAK